MTPADFERVADAIAIGISKAVARTVVCVLRVSAGAVVIGGRVVIIARLGVGAAFDFEGVTHAVAVGVRKAFTVAVVSVFSELTGPIVNRRVRIVVAGHGVHASLHICIRTEEESVPEFGLAIAVDEDLTVDLTADFARGGELANEDLEVIASDAIGVSIQGIPCTTDEVVDGNVVSRHSAAGLEGGQPGIVRCLHGAHVGFSSEGIGDALQSDRHPAVILEIGVHREKEAVDAIGGSSSECCLVKLRRGVDVRRVDGVTRHGGHEVIGVVHDNIKPRAAVTGEVGDAQGADQHADVFGHDFGLHLIPFRGRRGHHGACLKRKTGGGQEQAEQKAIGNHGEIISESSADKCTRISPFILLIANKFNFVEENVDLNDSVSKGGGALSPSQPTMLMMRPGTTMTFFGVRPCNCLAVRSSTSTAASTSAGAASAATEN